MPVLLTAGMRVGGFLPFYSFIHFYMLFHVGLIAHVISDHHLIFTRPSCIFTSRCLSPFLKYTVFPLHDLTIFLGNRLTEKTISMLHPWPEVIDGDQNFGQVRPISSICIRYKSLAQYLKLTRTC